MAKKKVFQKSKIALILAVMLIFCAFGADGIVSRSNSFSVGINGAESSLGCPGAGEFFTGSLPLEEQQSVRGLSADWQGVVILRPGRITDGKYGLKDTQVCIGLSDSLRKVTAYREYLMAGGGEQTAQGREMIVCYIHNQDGAKG